MDSAIIRECTAKDIDEVEALQHQWVNEEITHGLIPIQKNYLEAKLGSYFFVAEKDSEIIGFVYGTIRTADNMAIMNNGQTYLDIEDIFVTPDNRSSGLGSVLLDKILTAAKEAGVERSLVYSSSKDMEGIINFYKKHDYKTWYIQMFK